MIHTLHFFLCFNSCLICFDPCVRSRLGGGGRGSAALRAPGARPRRSDPHSRQRAMTNISQGTGCLLSGGTAGHGRPTGDPHCPLLPYWRGRLFSYSIKREFFCFVFFLSERSCHCRSLSSCVFFSSISSPLTRWIFSLRPRGGAAGWMCSCFLGGTFCNDWIVLFSYGKDLRLCHFAHTYCTWVQIPSTFLP